MGKHEGFSKIYMNLILIFLVIFIDLFSKSLVFMNISQYHNLKINEYFNIIYLKNSGIIFGIFKNYEKMNCLIVFLINIFIFSIFFEKIFRNKKIKISFQIGYSLIIGGSLGNFIDRFTKGFIIDFIDFHIKEFHFPIFNFADLSIFLGSILLILNMFIKKNN
ncbi:hypothetical protein AOQ88_02375 [Candidatus Riesia sp. GBBU]|nr:hypothetical protein AOQ88_02075 [Candidatus Riesia sp. GBBU]ARC55066.1 hypothetical protein AOQ88_02375 [Candidatus Riesia sp. GBBU]